MMENETGQIDNTISKSEDSAVEIITAEITDLPSDETVDDANAKAPSAPLQEDAFYQRGKKQIPIKHYKVGKFEFTNQNTYNVMKYALMLIMLASIRSITTYIFIVPNGFAPGGVSGISTILYNIVVLLEPNNTTLLTVFDPGITMFVLNMPFIIVAFFVLGKKFAVNTFFVISIYSGLMFLLGAVKCPQFAVPNNAGMQILAALAGGVSMGFCLGLMLRYDMSMAGTDIVGKIIHKHNPQTGAQWWILICDCTVATCSGILGIITLDFKTVSGSAALVSIISPILFSFISLITSSLTADVLQSGFQSSIVFNIITDKSDEISTAISEKLHRGVTLSTAMGYYTKTEHKILTCVVSKRQIATVKNIIKECDPLAFTYTVKAHEVAGKGFHSAG